MVEQGVFPKIQDLLEPNFVEARLHTDLPSGHERFRFDARIQEVRVRFLGKGNIGLPQYVVVSPRDIWTPRATKFDGSLGGKEAFVKFLESARPHRTADGNGGRKSDAKNGG